MTEEMPMRIHVWDADDPAGDLLYAYSSLKHAPKGPTTPYIRADAVEELREAAEDFVEKLDRGESRSTGSYARFKAALAKMEEGTDDG